jgi:hypothetical protein
MNLDFFLDLIYFFPIGFIFTLIITKNFKWMSCKLPHFMNLMKALLAIATIFTALTEIREWLG